MSLTLNGFLDTTGLKPYQADTLFEKLRTLGLNLPWGDNLTPLGSTQYGNLRTLGQIAAGTEPYAVEGGLPVEYAIDVIHNTGYRLPGTGLGRIEVSAIEQVAMFDPARFTAVYEALREHLGYTGCFNLRQVFDLSSLTLIQEGEITPRDLVGVETLTQAIAALAETGYTLPIRPRDALWNATIGRIFEPGPVRNYIPPGELRQKVIAQLNEQTGLNYD